jgi:Tfp pilus assembly protein PilO
MAKPRVISAVFSRFSQRERTVLFFAAAAVSLLLIDRVIVGPVVSKIESLTDQIDEKKVDVERDLRILSYRDRIISERARYDAFLTTIRPEQEEITALLKEVEGLASESGIYLVDMKPRKIEDLGPSKKFVISLTCEAQMTQVIDFMYNIENSETLLTIEQYDISPKAKGSSIAKCTLSIAKLIIPK